MSVAEWGDELIIYHHQSGDTYMFAELTKLIVSFCLPRECFSKGELVERNLWCFDSQQQAENFIQSVMDQMIAASLITEYTL